MGWQYVENCRVATSAPASRQGYAPLPSGGVALLQWPLVTGGQTLPNDPRMCSNSKMSPNPRPNEVLIKVGAAGVNRADLLQRQALNPLPLREGNVLIKINVVTERLGKPRWASAGPCFCAPGRNRTYDRQIRNRP